MNKKEMLEARNLISGFLKCRREALGITQQKLADSTGMGIATIKRFESGQFWLNMKQYLLLCHHLKCCPLIGELEDKKEFSKMMREQWRRGNDEN